MSRLIGSPLSRHSLKFLSHPAIVGKRIEKKLASIMNVFILEEQNIDIGVSRDHVNYLAKFDIDSKS
jgi:hypothetical protein